MSAHKVVSPLISEEVFNFLDYLKGGLNISLYLGIDFTASNGVVTDPKSLHYVNPSNPDTLNPYQQAVVTAADVLLEYDADKLVPVYGFGANLNFPNLKTTGASHCFPCSGEIENDEKFGIQGIFEAYNFAMRHISLNGPTNFEPLFRKMLLACQAKQREHPDNYSFFMAITDGDIHDFRQTG